MPVDSKPSLIERKVSPHSNKMPKQLSSPEIQRKGSHVSSTVRVNYGANTSQEAVVQPSCYDPIEEDKYHKWLQTSDESDYFKPKRALELLSLIHI